MPSGNGEPPHPQSRIDTSEWRGDDGRAWPASSCMSACGLRFVYEAARSIGNNWAADNSPTNGWPRTSGRVVARNARLSARRNPPHRTGAIAAEAAENVSPRAGRARATQASSVPGRTGARWAAATVQRGRRNGTPAAGKARDDERSGDPDAPDARRSRNGTERHRRYAAGRG